MEDLFGYEHNGEVKKGILENSDGKLLCIQDAQYLSDQAQEKNCRLPSLWILLSRG